MMDCWICGQPANSGEHLLKASDLKASFGTISQNQPLYYHSQIARNVRKRSVKDNVFKSKALLCTNCNNARSQPYDRAWERLSEALTHNDSLRSGQLIKLRRIFSEPRKSLLDVHLYFVKLFGCRIVENSIPIDTQPFADALLQRKAHSQVFIAIGPSSFTLPGKKIVGLSEVNAHLVDGRCTYAQWFYHVQNVAVLIMYAEQGEQRRGLLQAWHPDTQARLLRMARFG